jgi:hypothetical protein
MHTTKSVSFVLLFAIAFALVESAVVVYLRALYYPEGFQFPLKLIDEFHIKVELAREAATIMMLVTIGLIAGTTAWSRFGYFLIAFGVWDIFYYIWLKAFLDWPASLFEWDVLFLIPLPWIGPVIGPVLISLLMIIAGLLLVQRVARGEQIRVPPAAWWISFLGTGVILFSFMLDLDATLNAQMPMPYRYELLLAGLAGYLAAMYLTFFRTKGKSS